MTDFRGKMTPGAAGAHPAAEAGCGRQAGGNEADGFG